jgi:Flp pilus assembly protein TadG
MVTAILAFTTSLLCALSLVFIELFHMMHTKQQNGIVFWRAVDAMADKMNSMLNTEACEPDPREPQQPLDSPV